MKYKEILNKGIEAIGVHNIYKFIIAYEVDSLTNYTKNDFEKVCYFLGEVYIKDSGGYSLSEIVKAFVKANLTTELKTLLDMSYREFLIKYL